MLEKIKNKLENSKTGKIERLVSFLVVLIITLIIMNSIIKKDNKIDENKFNKGEELVIKDIQKEDLEKDLEYILSKIKGIGNVNVLITYSESQTINPLFNENTSLSTTEEDSKITKTESTSKEILIDSTSKPIIQNTSSPKIEGAIIIAEGASSSEIKNDIILAVEAATGLLTHKIQVFEMKQ